MTKHEDPAKADSERHGAVRNREMFRELNDTTMVQGNLAALQAEQHERRDEGRMRDRAATRDRGIER